MNEEIILGTLLGDAWIQQVTDRDCSYIFAFEQANEDYTKWKADILGIPYSIVKRNKFDKRTNKTYTSYHCHLTLDKLIKKYYYNLFYTPKKEVTLEVLNKLSDLSIAIWYMDDGNMYYNGDCCQLTLSINGFSEESRELIRTWFKEKYDINFKANQKAIRVTSNKECQKFMDIVEKHIPECMEYKLLSKAREKYNNSLSDDRKKYRNNKYKN